MGLCLIRPELPALASDLPVHPLSELLGDKIHAFDLFRNGRFLGHADNACLAEKNHVFLIVHIKHAFRSVEESFAHCSESRDYSL